MTTSAPCEGDYFCVTTHDFAGALIRFGTRNHWNHCGIVVDGGKVVEARVRGADVGNVFEYGPSNDLILNDHEYLTSAQVSAITAKAKSLVGTPYGFLDIAWLALYSLGIKWKWLYRRVHDEKRMICSQLVATCYEAAGITLVPGKTAQEVTPGDLANRIARGL